ncbi:uncharacterized ATP-dependent helicase C29A10.10c isoform X2 [Spinacia oleracea]|uniref:Uncharacterized ATP-dependent helicase C29A10.10c isoform X2 n=1 Tax=Spinacia oleracea TaxID=3562 RepID=A0A9R0K640_SPIOL|nr:uncharacterized ATP-dependent helicase C29A10.10c-like isoform X2 [Spinacia oleracea]
MMNPSTGKKEGGGYPDLLKLVFSWSIKDVHNDKLYSGKVKQIPDTFSSTANYCNSFKWPLIEETRAEYYSGLESISHAPACEISGIWYSDNYKPPKDLYYDILTKKISDFDNQDVHYEPESGDLFAITNRRPRNVGDLLKPDNSFHFAFVTRSNEVEKTFEILSSEKIDRKSLTKSNGRLYVTYLMNITTNLRIWKALNTDPQSKRLGLIQKVLQHNSSVDDNCPLCNPERILNDKGSKISNFINSFGLNKSQIGAVLSSISLAECSHQDYNVKLIWGPPGTGKTKTVASLLYLLVKLKFCTTLTCAPTNIAVIQVAKKLVTLFLESEEYDTYGLGDIVLFGNEERMKINDHDELVDIFLKYRVKLIDECLSPFTGWKKSLETMIPFLEDPKARYDVYSVQNRKSDIDEKVQERKNNTKVWRKVINQTVKENEDKDKKGLRNGTSDENQETKIEEEYMTYEEFMRKTFFTLANRLVFCSETLYTHLPTSHLPLSVAKHMIRLVYLLRMTLESSENNVRQFSEVIMMAKGEILAILKFLYDRFPKPRISGSIKVFCLENARLMFCTASGSINVKSPVDMVIIDEAAQLKECESAIPLQIQGLRNAVLVGDDRQLPAMIQSQILEKKNFGRSLFQRLARLGKKRQLLNIQYRMHPSISLFPNKQFYDSKIVDAPNVREKSYVKSFLKGAMYGSYSFINVPDGRENFKKGHSPRNFEEAAVVDRIIDKLFKGYYRVTKQKVSVGVISPYKGQVGLLQEKLDKKYTKHKDKFCINIRSVDGFQGGEEDIIIISTVRSNVNGSVGFLSNCQRTNVALTRARFCLWIVGSGSTLGNSGSVWKNLVDDAKTRGCFYDAYDDVELYQPTLAGSSKRDFFGYLNLDKARWKVSFSNEFKISISNMSVKGQIRAKQLLHKIVDGWRHSNSEKPANVVAIDDPLAFALLELYKVDENINLAWAVEILEEESSYTQVIKVWDILPASRIRYLAKNVSTLFRNYTGEVMHRCQYRSIEGNLVVPMSWPLNPNYSAPTANPPSCLSNQLAAMNLGVNRGEPSSRARNNVVSVWKPVQR